MDIDKLAEPVLRLKNVVGYSGDLRPRNAILEDEKCLLVYVTEKVPLSTLRLDEIIPSTIEDIPTDIFAIGTPTIGEPTDLGRRDAVHPLVSGISVGNWSITAGTLGRAVKKGRQEYLPSNAHVLTDGANKTISKEKRIIQPGKHDGGRLRDLIGYYTWHDRIFSKEEPSDCPVSRTVITVFNYLSKHSGRRSRLKSYVEGDNHQDFAVAEPIDGIEYEVDRTYDFDLEGMAFALRLFAGSDKITIGCKAKYQLEAGYDPVDDLPIHDVNVGDVIRKSGRTTFDTNGEVIDDTARVMVTYGNFKAMQRDVVMLTYMSAGGDSGSDMYFEMI